LYFLCKFSPSATLFFFLYPSVWFFLRESRPQYGTIPSFVVTLSRSSRLFSVYPGRPLPDRLLAPRRSDTARLLWARVFLSARLHFTSDLFSDVRSPFIPQAGVFTGFFFRKELSASPSKTFFCVLPYVREAAALIPPSEPRSESMVLFLFDSVIARILLSFIPPISPVALARYR